MGSLDYFPSFGTFISFQHSVVREKIAGHTSVNPLIYPTASDPRTRGAPRWEILKHNQKNETRRPALASEIRNERGRYGSSSTEAGVLIAHHRATARPLPKEERTINGGGTQSTTIAMPTGEASSWLLIRQNSYPYIYGAPSGGSMRKILEKTLY
ncbi:hypothetical protein AVEN_140949-1 [Araneus ventricosus]|uniref:Uncharacterized protein n=1 Tax=Araneus ventricosus TaxID=182803 RepID=A0A4Y2GE25_ARAVE|nr:hypothetical protein AVEN_140949-1 [Araneus ventricosus]